MQMLTACLAWDMRKYLPDDLTLGALQYFAALTCVALPQANFDRALQLMSDCYKTHWVDLLRLLIM